MVGMYSYDHQPGTYNLIVDTTESVTGEVEGNSVECATWDWDRNVTLNLEFTANTQSGELIIRSLNNVTFNNFFSPMISDIEVVVDGTLRYVSWNVADRNLYDSHRYEVRYSIDRGQTYQLLASNVTRESYVWNTAGYDEHEVCLVRITAYDELGLSGTIISSEFSIGAEAEFTGSFWYSTSSSGNSSYIWGSEDNEVVWRVWIENRNSLEYLLLIDTDVIQTGWTVGEEISVNTDGLSLGLHSITLILIAENERRDHIVYIEVLPDPQQAVIQSIGSASAGFILFAVLILAEYIKKKSV
jgi:hypothetical protein